jgi:hypothetical protein
MAMARIILGEVFIAILAFAVVYAALSPTLQPTVFPQVQLPWFAPEGNVMTERYSLVKGTNVSQSINFVNLDVAMKLGGVYIIFSDRPNVAFEAVFQHAPNTTELDASASEDGGKLQVNAYAETGGLNLTLGKDYQYNGSLNIRLGGLAMKLGQDANISKFAVQIRYLGGVWLTINNGASFEQLDLNIDLGGLQLNVDADDLGRSGVINTSMNIGGLSLGVNVDTGLIGVSLDATVDIGGVSVNHSDFTGSVSSTHCSVKTMGYGSAVNKLDIKAIVGLGGVTLQQNVQRLPGFET